MTNSPFPYLHSSEDPAPEPFRDPALASSAPLEEPRALDIPPFIAVPLVDADQPDGCCVVCGASLDAASLPGVCESRPDFCRRCCRHADCAPRP